MLFAITPTKGSARLMHPFTSSSASSQVGTASLSPLYSTVNFQGWRISQFDYELHKSSE